MRSASCRPAGIALPDLIILLVVVGLGLAVLMPEMAAARRRAAAAELRDDLRRLAAAQESYFYDHRVYSADPAELRTRGFSPHAATRVVVHEATLTGWSAVAARVDSPVRCYVFVQGAAPVGAATEPGEIACD